jgi:uncharacterized membrane protein
MAAIEAVNEVFEKLGIDTSEPIEIQADMQAVRNWRMSQRTAKKATVGTVVTVLVTGLLALIYNAFISGG